jgi:hypothetical protein
MRFCTACAVLQVFALVWAGSQVTKVFRLGGALLLAPFADRVLISTQRRLKLKSKQQTFSLLATLLLGSTLLLFCAQVVSSGLMSSLQSGTALHKALLFCWAPRLRQHTALLHSSAQAVDSSNSSSSSSSSSEAAVSDADAAVVASDSDAPTVDDSKYQVLKNGVVIERRAVAVVDGRPVLLSPQKLMDLNTPSQQNVHGWQQQPKFLLGYWALSELQPILSEQQVR